MEERIGKGTVYLGHERTRIGWKKRERKVHGEIGD